MQTILLFGGTGNLGKKIAEELVRRNYTVNAVVRNESKAAWLKSVGVEIRINEVTPSSLNGICHGFDAVISALGKSVSPNDKSRPSFKEVDLNANSAILAEAVKSGVKKFVYVSALHAEKYPQFEYFRVHHEFSERLKQSGIDYSIIKPPALFSAFVDLIEMAKKGRLVTMGKGDKRTNPIYEGDLAKLCVDALQQSNSIIEAGGKEVLTRKQINEIIQAETDATKKVRSVPLGLVKAFLPVLKLVSKDMYDKVAFFTEVMQHDTIAPKVGEMKLADYLKEKANRK